jgi:hypothetical protein
LSELVQQVADQGRILLQSNQITLDLDYDPEAIGTFDEDLVIGVLVACHQQRRALHARPHPPCRHRKRRLARIPRGR